MNFSVLFLASFLLLFSFLTASIAEELPEKPSAFLLNTKGDVRIKPRGSVVWVEAKPASSLFPGDKIFTGPDGTVQVEYQENKFLLEMKPHSMMRIGYQAPRMSQFKRRFGTEGAGNKGKELTEPTEAGVRILGRPDDISPTKDESNRLEFEVGSGVRKVNIVSPQAKTILGIVKAPGKISLQVSTEFKQEKLWAYVWQKNKGTIPILKIFSKGDFPEIQIPEEGRYLIQIVCEDESCASAPISLDAIQGTRAQLLERVSALHPEGNVTVVIP